MKLSDNQIDTLARRLVTVVVAAYGSERETLVQTVKDMINETFDGEKPHVDDWHQAVS